MIIPEVLELLYICPEESVEMCVMHYICPGEGGKCTSVYSTRIEDKPLRERADCSITGRTCFADLTQITQG